VLTVAATQGVALVHDLGEHGPALGPDPHAVPAALAPGVPPRGERHDALRVPVELAVALRRAAAVAALREVVERHDGLGAAAAAAPRPRDDHRRRAPVRLVGVPGLAAFLAGVVILGRRPQRADRLALIVVIAAAAAEAREGD